MSPNPLVSIVVSSYNQAQFIGDCIRGILSQTRQIEFEIVIVDDASTDNTTEVVAAFRDKRIRLTRHPENTGLVSTLNDCLLQARGEYVARIDGDDRYRPNFFAETLRVLEASPEIGLVYGDVAAVDEQGVTLSNPWNGIRSREAHHGQRFEGNELLALIQENFIPAPAVMARQTAWRAALPVPDWVFRDFPSTDWYLNLRMARIYPFCYLPLSVADYRLHGSNWHKKVGADPRVEATAFRILDQTFAEEDCADAKRRMRPTVYGRAYLRFAGAYMAAGNHEEARRCYRSAVRYRPAYLRSPAVLRGIVAAWVGPERYQSWKRIYRRAV
jgi:glycosyltransferase involved in cell wall biosynthesis